MKKINILHHNKYFGQSLPTFKSMDLDLIKNKFEKAGYNVEFISFEELAARYAPLEGYVLCGSHQNEDVKTYLDDILDVDLLDSNLIPNRRLIKAHNNKGYQGLLAKIKNIDYVEQSYFIELNELKNKVVLKRIDGAGSGGVSLQHTTDGLRSFLIKSLCVRIGIKRIAYLVRAWGRTFFKKNEYKKEILDYYKPKERYVIQEFIDGLDCDFKVLVFMDRCFILKRGTRDNDFRASGSGKFHFIKPDSDLLDFAFDCRNKLDAPYVSLDVINNGGRFQCIEYQCVHFGPYTQMKAPFYYARENNGWVEKKNETILEDLIVDSVKRFIEQKNN